MTVIIIFVDVVCLEFDGRCIAWWMFRTCMWLVMFVFACHVWTDLKLVWNWISILICNGHWLFGRTHLTVLCCGPVLRHHSSIWGVQLLFTMSKQKETGHGQPPIKGPGRNLTQGVGHVDLVDGNAPPNIDTSITRPCTVHLNRLDVTKHQEKQQINKFNLKPCTVHL